MLLTTGNVMLPYVFALAALAYSASFLPSKTCSIFGSWQNTFTTFCPLTISSI